MYFIVILSLSFYGGFVLEYLFKLSNQKFLGWIKADPSPPECMSPARAGTDGGWRTNLTGRQAGKLPKVGMSGFRMTTGIVPEPSVSKRSLSKGQ